MRWVEGSLQLCVEVGRKIQDCTIVGWIDNRTILGWDGIVQNLFEKDLRDNKRYRIALNIGGKYQDRVGREQDSFGK